MEVLSLAHLAFFVPAAVLVAATPGANNMLSLVNGIRAGAGRTMLSLFGRMAAFALLLAGVSLGLGTLFETSALIFGVVKWAGVAYLAWMAIGMIRRGSLGLAEAQQAAPRSTARMARHEFLVAIGNPKAILLFTAFLPQFVLSGADFAAQLWALGLVYLTIEFTVASLYAATGARMGRIVTTPGREILAARISGVILLAMAGLLATARRSS